MHGRAVITHLTLSLQDKTCKMTCAINWHVHVWHHAQIDEITLLNTVLIKWDGTRIICPNNKLSMDLLINVTRSQKKGEVFKV